MKSEAQILEMAKDLVEGIDEVEDLPLEVRLALQGRNVVIPHASQTDTAEFWRFVTHVGRMTRIRFGRDSV